MAQLQQIAKQLLNIWDVFAANNGSIREIAISDRICGMMQVEVNACKITTDEEEYLFLVLGKHTE